ncbi:hypothetical protein GCM10007907_34190 [Chitinimonas prasina]|uniref:Isochorismatase family protein n=1 Tax=Chitinimonas prasina TaxID=1434937 RepID=A0ABQ5YKZ2_9NEIS|nr:hypothetical protein [Chitinimonas prasina]GLR14629.1 hypothetical protein GCM10007907_34190 [Chitinimonas prasina]
MNTLGKTQLLIIDPQNDFCDIPGAALPVPGAQADMQRLAGLVARIGQQLDAIHVTLDTHNPLDIAHPGWWQDAAGASPAPFTVISVDDVRQGRWQARDASQAARSLAYVQTLAERGRYQLIIWPEHCLLGSWGHNVEATLFAALLQWGRTQLRTVNYVTKGINPTTEHYSAIQAEVPDDADPDTLVNQALLARLRQADTILIAGEALSHCVASTVRDLAEQLGPGHIGKLMLLTDCASPVSGFESLGRHFVEEMSAMGMRTMTVDRLPSQMGLESADATVVLYRPTGPQELALVRASGNTRWPARLPEQPIFYPVTNAEYASEIAADWNVKASGSGYVTRFVVRKTFMDRYPVQCVGAAHHTEWWVPAEELEALNDNIVGSIEVIAEFN